MDPFHIGVLCSKTLNGLGRFEEWNFFFNFQFSIMLLTQRMRKSCTQLDFVCLGGQYYGLGQSNRYLFSLDYSFISWIITFSGCNCWQSRKFHPETIQFILSFRLECKECFCFLCASTCYYFVCADRVSKVYWVQVQG